MKLIDILCFLLLPAGVAVAAPEPGILQGETQWRDEVVLASAVEVPVGSVLTIGAGTVVRPLHPQVRIVVRGVLKVEGTASAPVTFAAPAGWEGIEFKEAEAGSRLTYARFAGADPAISSVSSSFVLKASEFRDCATAVRLVRFSSPVIEGCRFISNTIAVDQEMKSAPVLRRNLFRGQRKAAVLATLNSAGRIEDNRFEQNHRGIALLRQYPGEIAGNRFTGNETGIYCEQTRNTPRVEKNLFEKNAVALENVSFSSPQVEGNRFIGNKVAIRNDQLGSPEVRHNLLRENGTAVASLRRSAPHLEKNLFEENEQALLCDFSSYPQVVRNNFLGNRFGVRLGDNQSGDFEQQIGTRGAVQEKIASRRGQSPGNGPPIPMATPFVEHIDVRENWWGEDTQRLAASGPDGNVDIFFDRADRPTVTMPGYGTQRFRLDRVLFHPWLAQRVSDAGPLEDRSPKELNPEN